MDPAVGLESVHNYCTWLPLQTQGHFQQEAGAGVQPPESRGWGGVSCQGAVGQGREQGGYFQLPLWRHAMPRFYSHTSLPLLQTLHWGRGLVTSSPETGAKDRQHSWGGEGLKEQSPGHRRSDCQAGQWLYHSQPQFYCL